MITQYFWIPSTAFFFIFVHTSHCVFITFIAIGVATSCGASLFGSPLASMFAFGSAGGRYCLCSARVRGKIQVSCWVRRYGVHRIGLSSVELRPGWIEMDQCVRHRCGPCMNGWELSCEY
eukprot:scaffold670_cov58-Attheya_sp.AAC.3